MSRWMQRRRPPGCGTKRVFATEADATARLKKYAREGGMSARRAYECPWCGKWHLTSKEEAS